MSIFVIKQHGAPKDAKVDDTQVDQDTLPSDKTTQDGQDVLATPDIDPAVAELAEKKPDVMVRIDGPVGRVYTDALNKLLATESYMTMMPVNEDVPDVLKPDGGKQIRDVEVYATEVDQLSHSDVVELMNKATLNQSRNYVIAAETAGQVTMKMAMLENLRHLPNVKICYSRQAALGVIRGML